MKNKIIKFKEEVQDIDFSHLSDRNPFDCEELNDIIRFKIDLLFKRYFPKFAKENLK